MEDRSRVRLVWVIGSQASVEGLGNPFVLFSLLFIHIIRFSYLLSPFGGVIGHV